jgi:taurine--2-oxoglutarate transaminase
MLEVVAACKKAGVWPFAHFNRLQVTPPCTTTPEEARTGLAMIDQALEVADRYVTE